MCDVVRAGLPGRIKNETAKKKVSFRLRILRGEWGRLFHTAEFQYFPSSTDIFFRPFDSGVTDSSGFW